MSRGSAAACRAALTLLCLAACPAAAAEPVADEPTAGEPWPAFAAVDVGPGLALHREMFGFPATLSAEYDDDETEAVFQLSAKLRMRGSRFFVGYTQLSFWQVYNRSESSPFRETNYNPEVFYRLVPDNSRLERWGVEFGVEHQSNGRGEPDSRSWNRVSVTGHRIGRRFLVSAKAWYRLPEDKCPIGEDGFEIEACRDDSGYDDNPDLTDYVGYGELHVRYRWKAGKDLQHLHLMLRGNPATGKGAVGVDYSYPAGTRDVHWFVGLWHGYGESLIDYRRSITRLGVGVLFRR